MLLLVSGASGAGKTAARIHAAAHLPSTVEAVELRHFGPIPAAPTIAWRQRTVERAVRRAADLDAEGRHLLLAGDPVPAGEALAAPSADLVDIAVLLLDVDMAAQDARLDARHDPPELRHLHHGFAAWMRHHATDPGHVPEAITTDAWDGMRWDRWIGRDLGDRWGMTVLDGSTLSPQETGQRVAAWCTVAIAGDAPVFRAGWHR